MPFPSDLSIDLSRFDPTTIPAAQVELNKYLGTALQSGPKWYEVGAKAYRKLRSEGKARNPKEHPRRHDPRITVYIYPHPSIAYACFNI